MTSFAGVAVLACVVLTNVAAAQENETRIKRSDLPPAVERTVAAESQGATIVGLTREVEGGQTLYELELKVQGRTRDVMIDANGTVVAVETEVALDSLPPAVRAGIEAAAPGARITLVESLVKRGTLVAYEAHVVKDGRTREVQVGPDGKPLAHAQ